MLLVCIGLFISNGQGQEYFPLERGNHWSFLIESEDEPPAQTAYQVLEDSVYISGVPYFEMNTANFVLPHYVRVDANYIYSFDVMDSTEQRLIKLNSQIGEVHSTGGSFVSLTTLLARDTITLFDINTIQLRFKYDGLTQGEIWFSRDFGPTYEVNYGDPPNLILPTYRLTLLGCIIGDSTFGMITDISSGQILPRTPVLLENYPNPFNPETTIRYSLANTAYVRLSVVNILGSEVSLLAKGKGHAGTHSIKWNAADYPAGIYFAKLVVDNNVAVKQMLLLK